MFYGKDDVDKQFAPLLESLNEQELFLFEPMPSWKEEKEGSRWTDEFRIRDGHTKLTDGTWVTVHKVTTYVETLQKSTNRLYEEMLKAQRELDIVRRQKYEMEYGLRVAEKALKNSLALTKEMINE
jgi:hypothetical protein